MGLNRLLEVVQGVGSPKKVINGCINLGKPMATPGTV
jgi:hypothetical protein